ncbi:MAG TPA: Mur ligase family protein, partial [Candidatus Saccharimonadales bacterium]|nr:Mur ligase family protein [Candidatus Saccharimonadales bacterium]
MKKVAKSLVVSVLGWQVRRLRRKHDFRIIGIGGSMGKTSTKFALAAVLKQKFKIRYQQGNYNDIASVPLVFFGQNMPSLFNPLAWLVTFIKNEAVIRKVYPVDFVIVELGTDGPGQIAKFNQYLYLDIAILTAIAPEHMEFFEDLDAVAAEELSIAGLSKKLFFNADLCPAQYRQKIGGEHYAYGTITGVSYRLSGLKRDKHGFGFVVSKGNQSIIKTHHSSI